jgi:5-methylcytosine-specific restriction endonuclease McrA
LTVFTKDRSGNPGHPTRRVDMIRKLLKRKQVRITGGGPSGKPVVVIFLYKEFDPDRTVNRRFINVIDPGYNWIGFAVCEIKGNRLIVLCKGDMETFISDIKLRMTERRDYRRMRRYISRYKKRRLSARQSRPLTKFKKPRNIRTTHRISATLRHTVDIHLNMYALLQKLCPSPVYQTERVIEDNTFDTRTMTWGPARSREYQVSPRQTETEKKCLICSETEDLQRHHLIPRKQGGTDVRENLIYLCRSCHEDIHTGRVYLPVKGVNQWRALGTMNAVAGILNQVSGLRHVTASDVALVRKTLGIEKGHANDAVATGAAYSHCYEVVDTGSYLSLKKTRRHNRARVHAVRDRLYKIDGKIVARNRRKRTGQKEASFAELSLDDRKRVTVYPGIKLLNPLRERILAISGDIWVHKQTGKRFVATGVVAKNYIYSPDLKGITGKTYINPDQCRRVLRNEGVVICDNRNQAFSRSRNIHRDSHTEWRFGA